MHHPRLGSHVRFLPLLALACALPACMDNNFSQLGSLDKTIWKSTVDKPLTLVVVDPFTKQEIWKMEVPVNHQVTLEFDRAGDVPFMRVGEHEPNELTWRLYGPDSNWFGLESGTVNLPATPVLVKASYRPAPEYPSNWVPPESVDANLIINPPKGKSMSTVRPGGNGPTTGPALDFGPTPGVPGVPSTQPAALPATEPAMP